MRYLPNLIPEGSRVLKGYFKGSVYRSNKKSGPAGAFGWIFGLFFLLGAFAELPHPPLAFCYALMGILLLPPGHRWIEKTFRFRFRTKAKTIFCAIVLICATPLIIYYGAIDRAAFAQAELKAAQEAKEKAAEQAREQQQKDSVNFYLRASDRLAQQHYTAEAAVQLQLAAVLATTPEEKKGVADENGVLSVIRMTDLVNSGQYEAAIPELNTLIAHYSGDANLFYKRALCYSQIGQIGEAVKDCKSAAALGNKEAEQLNDKINPVRKHITGYMTQCCDGSYSEARGRGACSHHGGVCSWNAPIYEESRKYE